MMKKLITIATLLCFALVFGQRNISKKVRELETEKVTFKAVTIFKPSTDSAFTSNKVVEKATYVSINTATLIDIMSKSYDHLELKIPYNGTNLTLLLYKVNPFSNGFHVDSDTKKNIAYTRGVYYRGIIKGDYESVVSFNFFDNELNGVISSDTHANLVVGKLQKPNNSQEYIIYSDANMKVANGFNCAVKEDDFVTSTHNKTQVGPNSEKCVTLYFEVDHDLFVANNSSIANTTNWMTAVFNNIQTLFNNDGITSSLKSIFIWTTPDPYEGIGNTSVSYLYKFNEIRPVFDGDLGQLVGIDPGSLGGVAVGINGLCSQNNFCYSDVNFEYETVPTFSWTLQVLIHEFGHLLGSHHTHRCSWNGNNTSIDGCGQQAGFPEGNCTVGPIPSTTEKGTLMSYCHLVSDVGVNFNNGFGPQPSALILNAMQNSSCLSFDCITTCINTISNINITNVTANSATITWTDSGTISEWRVRVYPFGETPGNWETAMTNSYLALNLNPNSYYVVSVGPNCTAGLEIGGSKLIFVTAAAFCDGIEFADTGGTTGNYTNNETVIRTIVPNEPNNAISITFSTFSLELDYDYLYVYDGNSTTATDLSNGGFTGNTIPPPLTSSAIDGSLTVKFFSDQGVVDSGFVATISCAPSLNITDYNGYIDFSYFPNPTNGKVQITSKTSIDSVTVYNVAGQLLYNTPIDTTDAIVDLSDFAQGTYFFKLRFDEKEVCFRVLKM
jgi:hypothetical protein